MKFTVKTRGFREVEKKLSNLKEVTGRNVLRKVAKGALEPMADVAAQKAPEESGILSFSIVVTEKRTRRAKTGFGKNYFQRVRGIQMAMGPATGLGATYYAAHVEFGTIDTPAQPYMRPAWDTGAMKALDYVQDNLWREVAKAVGRVQKKAGR